MKITRKGERSPPARGYIEIVASVAIADRPSWPHDEASRLYEEHSDWLLGYCCRQLGGGADAEDAVQTTFLYAFRALRRGVVPECERAWLTTIARNVCSTQRRALTRRPEDATELDLDRIALAQPELDEAGFVDDVRAALAALPARQRRALVRREWQGVPSNEIATELDLTESATHALLFRARRSFATALAVARRPVAALNMATLAAHARAWLKPLLEGATVKAAVATTAAGVVIGGAVLEQRADTGSSVPAPARPAATVGEAPGSGATGETVRPRTVPQRRQVVPRAPSRPARASTSSAVPTAPPDTTVVRLARVPRNTTEPQPTPPPEPPAAEAPSPPPPAPASPVEPPAPLPVELPPILGEEPPVELPPPLDELLPPVEAPPLPLPPPPLPVPELPSP